MKLLAAVLLVTGSTVFAQGTSATGSGYGRIVFPGGAAPPGRTNTGMGRIVFPGTGAPAVIRPGVSPGPVFPILTGPVVPHQAHSNRSIIPIPVFYGGGYYPYDPPPAETFVRQPPVAAWRSTRCTGCRRTLRRPGSARIRRRCRGRSRPAGTSPFPGRSCRTPAGRPAPPEQP